MCCSQTCASCVRGGSGKALRPGEGRDAGASGGRYLLECMHATRLSIADYSPNPLCGFLNRADANSRTGSAGNSRSGPLEFPSPSIMIGRMTGRGRMQTGRHGGRGTPSNRASGEAGSRPAIGIRQSLSGYDGYTQIRTDISDSARPAPSRPPGSAFSNTKTVPQSSI